MPGNMGREIIQGMPGMDELQKLLQFLGVAGNAVPRPGAAPSGRSGNVAGSRPAPVYRDAQGRPYDYPVDAYGNPLP